MENERLPDDQVIIKLAKCSRCKGIVTAAVKHLMTKRDILSMGAEAIEYNHIVTEIALLDYRKPEYNIWCYCSELPPSP